MCKTLQDFCDTACKSCGDKLPAPGHEVKLLTHLAVREDAHVLYGFMTTQEREMFRLLINTVSGIGPKLALNVLSDGSVAYANAQQYAPIEQGNIAPPA